MKQIFVEGHRGYCAVYPENTLISFEAALDLGVNLNPDEALGESRFVPHFSIGLF